MREEIFGPILPILHYRDLDEAIDYVNAPRPPAGAVPLRPRLAPRRAGARAHHRRRRDDQRHVLHIAQNNCPSAASARGMGHYHGHHGFLTFSKQKPVFRQARWSGMAGRPAVQAALPGKLALRASGAVERSLLRFGAVPAEQARLHEPREPQSAACCAGAVPAEQARLYGPREP
jgi:hypothetical protein